MNTLLILGTGCAKCAKLQALTTQAASEIGLACEIKKISDLKTIMLFGVMTTARAGGEQHRQGGGQSSDAG
ncbi:MAG TPA: thioredoxin family protein [Candidatus Limnocylindrales bacterium]|nr:thioredoxin family protein [Candidatus Limnocylindrales bacterium]